MISNCPQILRRQRLATLRLAKAFREHDRASAALNRAATEVDEAFSAWAGTGIQTIEEARGKDAVLSGPAGGIVGMARIVDCVTEWPSEWFFGRYGFVLRDAFPVDLIPCKGQLGFFAPPEDALASLAATLRSRAATGEQP